MKRIIALFTCALMFTALLVPAVYAESVWETFENEDGTLTVTGYNGPGGDVTIPAQIDGKTVGLIASEVLVGMSESVTSFSAEPGSAFYTAENGVLYSVPDPAYPDWKFVAAYPKASAAEEFYIPDYVWQFDPRVCAGADALKKVSFPQGIASIASEAFADCTSLREARLPDGLGWIENRAFAGCSALREIAVPDGIKNVRTDAFVSCEALEKVSLPGSLRGLKLRLRRSCRVEYRD